MVLNDPCERGINQSLNPQVENQCFHTSSTLVSQREAETGHIQPAFSPTQYVDPSSKADYRGKGPQPSGNHPKGPQPGGSHLKGPQPDGSHLQSQCWEAGTDGFLGLNS